VAKVEFENSGLYLSRDDYKNAITKNAVCLTLMRNCLEQHMKILKKRTESMFLLKVFLTARKKAILTGVLEQLITLQGTRFGSSLNHH